MPRLPKGLKYSLNEVSQTIDVSEILGVDVSDRPRLVQEFGQAVIDTMVDRTESGKDIDGKKFTPKYSKSYIASDEFKDFDKSPSDVNMTLRGRMLDSIDISEQDGSVVKVAVGAGVDTKKAYNHNTGDTLPKRVFFGMTSEALGKIADKFKDEVDEIRSESVSESRTSDEQLKLDVLDLFSQKQAASSTAFADAFGDLF